MFFQSSYITKHFNDKEPIIYLSFDDGPNHYCTEDVLALLHRLNVKATFFIIGDKCRFHSEIIQKVLKDGHAMGNHSLDHSYYHFFLGKNHIRTWIQKSEKLFEESIPQKSVGFRSPAGVVTQNLIEVLKELNIPLIHWNRRYFDSVFPLTEKKILHSLSQIRNGSIILLHDNHYGRRKEIFLKSLSLLIIELQKKGFRFETIKKNN